MSQTTGPHAVELNGSPAAAGDLAPLAFAGYGHFTSMQVRGHRVRGLGLHLARLRAASEELFGRATPDARVREYLRRVVGRGDGAMSVQVNVFSSDGDAVSAGRPVEPDVLVRTGPPRQPSPTAVRVGTARFGRVLPHLKNTATMATVHRLRQARLAGHDDVLFVGDDGAIAEGSIWNIAFLDGTGTVWPSAPALRGVMMQVVQAGLTRAGHPWSVRRVTVGDLAGVRGAALMNSITPAQPVAAVDGQPIPVDEGWLATLRAAHDGTPPEAP
jgi:branched-subunit amino acid aminotransferase/4-amino-4-deoxychorismate lyase